jgi:3-dehydroquinate dehydratase-1
MHGRPLAVHGRELPYPAVCAPLVARTPEALHVECAAVAAKRPDLIEWRVDFFNRISDERAVLASAAEIRSLAAGIPILFTRRSLREGGERVSIDEGQVLELYRAVCASGDVDMVDFEAASDAAHVAWMREMTHAAGIGLVLSFHDFRATPPADAIVERFRRAQALGADVAKVAVMPGSRTDVLALLAASAHAADELAIPVVSMSMGALGAVTRTSGWLFGSAMTFAVGHGSSAPGQMPIEDVHAAIAMLRRASGVGESPRG